MTAISSFNKEVGQSLLCGGISFQIKTKSFKDKNFVCPFAIWNTDWSLPLSLPFGDKNDRLSCSKTPGHGSYVPLDYDLKEET